MPISHPSDGHKTDAGGTPEATPKGTAQALALRLLLGRPLSARQLYDKLVDKGFAHDSARAALDSMRDYGYIDDAKLAEMMRASAARQGKGPAWIKQQLSRRGVAGHLIAEAAKLPDDEALEQATALVRRRFAKPGMASDRKMQARVLRFLASRGFGAQTAYAAVRAGLEGQQAEDTDPSMC